MNNRAFVAIGMTLVLGLGAAAFAQPADPIATRQALMKQNGKDTKAGAALAKGEVPYDAARAAMLFKDMNEVANNYGKHFPANSQTGGDTEAAPAIWTKPAEFKAALAKFQADTKAAMAAKPVTVEAFRVQFGAVTANCKSCHESFRVKKD